MVDLEHQYVQANGIRIHYVTAGKGPLVVLLHGFPEFWHAWRHQIPALAEHFQVVVPDLRGYGETERPPNVADYQPDELVLDLVGFIHAMGKDKAHVIGHDWGGGIAWRTVIQHPEVIDHLVVLNCPHPKMFAKALQSNYAQMRKSWYIFLFQIPYLPELMFQLNSKNTVKKIFKGLAVQKDAFTEADLEAYHQALIKPGAYSAALNYYRAAFRNRTQANSSKGEVSIKTPTMLIWGEEDRALGKELTYGMEPLFSGPFQIQYIPNSGHWVMEEQPDRVNQLILQFLQGSSRVEDQ